MKVLFLCHRVPFPPKRGGKIRPFNIIRHLTGLGHEVTVASLARTPAELDEAQGLREHCSRLFVEIVPDLPAWLQMVARIPSIHPSSFGYFHSPALASRIDAELASGGYDLVFVHCSSMAPYVIRSEARHHITALRILDFGDMDSQKWREYVVSRRFPLSLAFWIEAVKLERAERQLAAGFDLCTCTTAAEMDSLRALGVVTPSAWFPNGVDAGFFSPQPDYEPDLVCFVGRMDYFPNQLAVQSFCRDILPPLRRVRPQARFEIVGAEPPSFIRELGREPGVLVTGSVPDVRPYVTRAAVTVAPLAIARGTQNKILESMAMGVPVVCSPAASRGVDAIPGEHLLVADSDGDYVALVANVLSDPALRARLSLAGRERVLEQHAWSGSMRRLDGLIAQARDRRQLRPMAAAVTAI